MTENIPHYAGGFLFDQRANLVLLHLRDFNTAFAPGKWSFFGGLCEREETPEQAFVRELKEELRLEIRETELIHLRSYLNEKLQTHRHVFYIKKAVPVADITLGEGAGFGWISLERVFDYDLTDKVREDLTYFVEQYS